VTDECVSIPGSLVSALVVIAAFFFHLGRAAKDDYMTHRLCFVPLYNLQSLVVVSAF
jgi:hypothetical protein